MSYAQFMSYLDEVYKPEEVSQPALESIPVSVFDNGRLSALEGIVKYLRENKQLRLSEIAKLIGRDQRAVGVTYGFAARKLKLKLKAPSSKYSVPLAALANRKLAVLETIVHHLKTAYSLSYHEVALIMKRDDRTVWTVYQRALKKIR